MINKKIIFGIVLTITVFFYFNFKKTYISKKSQTQQFLIVGTSADYPPYAQIDLETGLIIGFEIDIISEIAQRLNKKIIIKDMPFNSLIIELMSGQIDMIAAALTPSPERAHAILFSKPYLNDDALIVVYKKTDPAIQSITDLYGKTVAVNTGYTSDTFLSQYPNIQLTRLKSPPDCLMALQSNSVDAFVTATSSFHVFLEQQEQSHNYQFFTLPYSADNYAFAYEKNNHTLQKEIDPLITNMIEDGTIETIKNRWKLT